MTNICKATPRQIYFLLNKIKFKKNLSNSLPCHLISDNICTSIANF